MDSGWFLNTEKHFYLDKNDLSEGIIEFIL